MKRKRFDHDHVQRGLKQLVQRIQSKEVALTEIHLNYDDDSIGIRVSAEFSLRHRSSSNVESLTLCSDDEGPDFIRRIRETLPAFIESNGIEVLAIWCNFTHFVDVEAIASALGRNKSIKHFALGDFQAGDSGVEALARMLLRNKTLERLDMKNVGLDSENATPLFRALGANTSVVKLDLSNNGIEGDGFIALMTALQRNKTLEELNLSSNLITEDDFAAAASEPHPDINLRRLQLGSNDLWCEGTTYVAEALFENRSVEVLDLRENCIGHVGMEALAQLICRNTSITHLELGEKQRSDGVEDFEALFEAFGENQSIANLGLHGLDIDEDEAVTLVRSVAQRPPVRGVGVCSFEGRAAEENWRQLRKFSCPGAGSIQNMDSFAIVSGVRFNATSSEVASYLARAARSLAGRQAAELFSEPKNIVLVPALLQKLTTGLGVGAAFEFLRKGPDVARRW